MRIVRATQFTTACLLGFASFPAASQVSQSMPAVLVTAPTPLPGFGVPKDQIPANLAVADVTAMRGSAPGAQLPELMSGHLPGIHVNDYQGNALQTDVSYRGFSASPLLGTPQGLSVFQDGVRINEPFGDVVLWDLVPVRALAGVTVVPGSNPLFGLNTLGGAIVFRTKSGDTHPGAEAEVAAGNHGRRSVEIEYGRVDGEDAHLYVAGAWTREDGWRDHSPSDGTQVFAKLGRRGSLGEFEVSLTGADTNLIGNGLVPATMLAARRSAIFTRPDNTRNRVGMINVSGSLFLSAHSQLSATLYYRDGRSRTLNGDANDNFEGGANDGETGANGGLGFNVDTASANRTATTQSGRGVALQWSASAGDHQWLAGTSYDAYRSGFRQTSQTGTFDAARGVLETGAEILENSLQGRSGTLGLFLADTVTLDSATHLSVSARWNRTHLTLRDTGPTAPAMNGDHLFTKLNPAVGITRRIGETTTLFGGISQGSRAPTPIELGCADPANPCTLPNAMASDPPLRQVVARTMELGVRGGGATRWNVGFFQTDSTDDILFVGTTTSAGYFTNFGKTRRRGLEAGLSGGRGPWEWRAGYTHTLATFRTAACLLAENNSSRGASTVCTPADGSGTGDDLIAVSPGNRMPGVPAHNLKLGVSYRAAGGWTIAAEVQALSSQYVRGNENNAHQAGTHADVNGVARTFLGAGQVAGYAVVNLSARADLGGGWEFFGRVGNLFDRRYSTGGALAENPFGRSGAFLTNSDGWARETFVAPGAPRSLWIGVRHRFGGA